MKDTFETNPGLAELFKRKILDIAKEVEFPEDLIDFNSHMDMKGTYCENLTRFYQAYPRLSERSDYLERNPIREISESRIELSYQAYQANNGVPMIVAANNGESFTDASSPELTEPSLPTLSFNFTYQVTVETPPITPQIALKHETAVQSPTPETGVSRLEERLDRPTHFLIIGDIGTAKTSLGCSILDEFHKKTTKPCFVYRHPKPDLFPSWVKPIANISELPQGAVCLIDEASKYFDQFSYRNSGNQELAEIMRLARQNDQTIILIAHTSTILNPNLVLPIAVYLLKEPTMFQRYKERPMVRQAYKEIKELRRVDKQHSEPIHKNEYYWLDSQTLERETFTKPDWFTDALSTAYSGSTNTSPQPQSPKPQPKTAPIPVRSSGGNQSFIQPLKAMQPFKPKRSTGVPKQGLLRKFASRPLPSFPRAGLGTFDPAGLLITLVLGLIGLASLVRGVWGIAVILLLVAGVCLLSSHSRFG
ncbi:MAG: hypothetical protein ACLP5V_13315 [Candidatus Bathyarchaeia archaeon]